MYKILFFILIVSLEAFHYTTKIPTSLSGLRVEVAGMTSLYF